MRNFDELNILINKNKELLKKFLPANNCNKNAVHQIIDSSENNFDLQIFNSGQIGSVNPYSSISNINHLSNNNFDVSGETCKTLKSSKLLISDNLIPNENKNNSITVGSRNYEFLTKSYSDDSFKTNLGKCLVNNNVNHNQCNPLLEVLRTHPKLEFLPKDARSLLHTPRGKIIVKQIPPGEYIHLGLEFGIQALLQKIQENSIPEVLIIDFSTDGAEINKTTQVWPIQFEIINVPNTKPEIAGVYVGRAKAEHAKDLFEDFVAEFNSLAKKGGVQFNNKLVPIKLRCFIADAPARAYVLNHVTHVGEFLCSQCKVQGVRHEGSMRFSGGGHQLRTSKEYREYCDKKHHEGQSALHDLPFDPVTQVPME